MSVTPFKFSRVNSVQITVIRSVLIRALLWSDCSSLPPYNKLREIYASFAVGRAWVTARTGNTFVCLDMIELLIPIPSTRLRESNEIFRFETTSKSL